VLGSEELRGLTNVREHRPHALPEALAVSPEFIRVNALGIFLREA
jgi:hypothetical protein